MLLLHLSEGVDHTLHCHDVAKVVVVITMRSDAPPHVPETSA